MKIKENQKQQQTLELPKDLPQLNQDFPLLLSDYQKLNVKSASYIPSNHGYQPLSRPIDQYLRYGCICLDKPSGPSSHEITSQIKNIFGCTAVGQSGTLDPNVSGILSVCMNSATRIVKQQQALEFIGFQEFIKQIGVQEFKQRCIQSLKTLTAPQLQRPPAEGCAVKRVLRVRTVYGIKFLECDIKNGRLLFKADVESGTYIRTLCFHIGLLVGCEAYMLELRRTRTGYLTKDSNMVTMHNLLDAAYLYKTTGDESLIRKVVMPLEYLLLKEKKIIVKDSAIAAICHGAQLLLQGVLRYSPDIKIGDKIILVSTKGEAISLAIATMSSVDICSSNHGVAAKSYRIIMDKELYEKNWKQGPISKQRQQLIKDGLLGEHGEIIEGKTPQSYIDKYQNIYQFLVQAGKTCGNAKQLTLDELIKYEADTTNFIVVDENQKTKQDVKQQQVQQSKQEVKQQEQQVQQVQEQPKEQEQNNEDNKEEKRHHKHHHHH